MLKKGIHSLSKSWWQHNNYQGSEWTRLQSPPFEINPFWSFSKFTLMFSAFSWFLPAFLCSSLCSVFPSVPLELKSLRSAFSLSWPRHGSNVGPAAGGWGHTTLCGSAVPPANQTCGEDRGKESSGSAHEKCRISLNRKDSFFVTLSAEQGTLSFWVTFHHC